MESCQTERWVSTSPYVKLEVTQASSTATSATLNWKLYYISDYPAEASSRAYTVKINGAIPTDGSGNYNINGVTGTKTVKSGSVTITKEKSKKSVSFSVSFNFALTWSGVYRGSLSANGTIDVAAKTSYTIQYNANGGTGAPASQTKWHGENLTISTVKPSRSGYTFSGWALSSGGSVYYSPGSTCGKNENLTLYAVWTANSYTITYDANGGTGAPASQTKSLNASVTISSTTPTQSGFVFDGWSNSATSSTVLYRPGDTYKANANITLYAVWSATPPPEITNFSVNRCESDGTLSDTGEYAKVEFNWAIKSSSTNYSAQINSYELGSSTVYISFTPSLTASTGTYTAVLGSSSILFDQEKNYTIEVTINDDFSVSEASLVLGESAYSLEFMPDNKGVRFPKIVQGNVLGLSDLPVLGDATDFNDITTTGVYSVKMNDSAVTMVNCPLGYAGRLIVAKSVGWDDPETNFAYLLQTYIPYLNIYPTYERYVRRNDTSTWIYGDWKVKTYATKDITFTPDSNVTVNRSMICRNNDIVTMYISFKYKTDLVAGTNNNLIGTIDSSNAPKYPVATAGMQNNTLVACWVRQSGEVLFRPSAAYTANKDIEFNLTWNVNASWD